MKRDDPNPYLTDYHARGDYFSRTLTWRYILSLALLAVMILLNHFLIQSALDLHDNDFSILNLAARQRMYSQRIAKDCLILSNPPSLQALQEARVSLAESLNQWQRAHDELFLGYPTADQPDLIERFEKLEPSRIQVVDAASLILGLSGKGAPATQMAEPLATVLRQSEVFLDLQDQNVMALENYFNQKLGWLESMEMGLTALSLLTLLLLAWLVFKPAAERIRNDTLKLSETARQLHRLSFKDSLTGVGNRRYLDQKVENEWFRAMRSQEHLSLIMVDIDHFKDYNDTHGHAQGDQVLKMVAHSLERNARRPGDAVARYGGEEFLAVLPNTAMPGALIIAETMRSQVEAMAIKADPQAGDERVVTISLGVASMIPARNTKSNGLLKLADDNLYLAKQKGRNRVEPS
jgi:diguanylate cyclase (GGDEF)-like protein